MFRYSLNISRFKLPDELLILLQCSLLIDRRRHDGNQHHQGFRMFDNTRYARKDLDLREGIEVCIIGAS
jgi:hypothetical protein